ncbi:MAG TPA: SH3 domain-containing protein [Stellaceae bacterium]|nr:SH3 domain-containing protein [Stellaceae bacterium]
MHPSICRLLLRLRLALTALLFCAAPMLAHAAEKALPVPRFVSLRADEVNLRTGPGERYPIDWVLTRKGLPVEIVEEFEAWRKIRDVQGTEGWVHQRMVTGTRNVVVTGDVRTLRADPEATAPAVARAEPGVIAHLLVCRDTWCRVELQDMKGWLKRSEVWGVYPTEAVP